MKPMGTPRGSFALGLVVGLLIGLAVALGVALYITKAPVPFLNKVPQRTAEQDSAETARNKNWDPNAPLSGKAARGGVAGAAPAASGVAAAPAASGPGVVPAPAPASAPAASRAAGTDPAAILSGTEPAKPAAEAFLFFVQAGAYSRSEDAEQQRAKLALIGQAAKISEREQSGRTVYRVRLGPFPSRDEAALLQARLQEAGLEAQIVRVERQ